MKDKKICSFTLDIHLYELLGQEARADDRSNSSMLNHILRKHFGKSA